jgi:hypothetical protein
MIKYLSALPLAVMLISGCATPKAVVSPRSAEDRLVVNGFLPGMMETMEFHENSGLFYKFEYDKDNLYLLLATSDETLKRKISYFGFTVWTDKTGNQSKDQGFRFPTGITKKENPPGSGMMPVQAPVDVKSLLERSDEIDLIGIYGNSVRTVKRRDSQIHTETRLIDSLLIYRAVVPFGLLKHGYSPVSGKGTMSIGFETGHLGASAPAGRSRDLSGNRPGGMQPGGMSGRRPGYSTGRMNEWEHLSAQRNEVSELSRPTRLWINLEFKHGNNLVH